MRLLRIAIVLVGIWLPPSQSFAQQELRIAAAADTQFVMPQIVAAFEHRTGHQATISFGASGNLSAQIESGAPFDIFFSADASYAKRLVDDGFADAASLYEYAQGKLVVFTPRNSRLDPSNGLAVLTDATVRRIAIANPEHAPYGKAAVSALKKFGIYDAISSKLVFGENIVQAFQFVNSGNADAGLLSLSLAKSPETTGKYSLVPENLYPPIQQYAVTIKNSQHRTLAEEFLSFLKTPEVMAMLQDSGLGSSMEDAHRLSGKRP